MAWIENRSIQKEKKVVRKIKKGKTAKIIFFSGFFCWRSWFIMEEIERWTCKNIPKNGDVKRNPKKYLSSPSNKKKIYKH